MKRKQARKVGVIGQIRQAFSRGNILGTTIGMILGGFVPVGSYVICHSELSKHDGASFWWLVLLIAGGLLFSAKTVWQWTRAAFQDQWKAYGFVLLLEGIMVSSETKWLSYSALALLVAVNGISTGVTLSRGK